MFVHEKAFCPIIRTEEGSQLPETLRARELPPIGAIVADIFATHWTYYTDSDIPQPLHSRVSEVHLFSPAAYSTMNIIFFHVMNMCLPL